MAHPTFYWTLPPSGDGRPGRAGSFARGGADPSAALGFTYYDYLLQVARAAKASGFAGVVIPWDANGEDPWIVAGAVVRQIPGLTFVPTLQPGFSTPVYVAKMSVSYQRLSGRRLGWALELEGDPAVRRAHGDFLTGDDWFARADEWVVAARGVWHHDDWSFEGRHYAVEAGGFEIPLAGQQFPELTTAGSSAAALAFAARHADVHLLSSPERVTLTDEAARLQKAAGETGRTVAAGLRLAVIARATEDEAKRDFERALLEVSPGKRGEPARPIEAHLWAGFDRSAGSHALVGSYEAVAAKLNELAAQGIHRFVLSGRPHLEEAYRFAERVAPRLQGWGIAARVPTIPTTHVTPAQVPAGAAV